MLKMLQVIGVSPTGYSEAVKQAVEEVIAFGEKPHFFEVIEQRGSVRDGQISEYQVKVNIAVETA
ncbi:MAG: dodecin domain-containing protein [Sedimentisphaerales bacterium]|nr:dodecin domain-containing protein [Sedimentisphaerales bacterium]